MLEKEWDYEVFAYTGQQHHQQRKYQDGYESNTKGYQLTDGTNGIYFGCGTGGSKFDFRLEGRWGWFTIFYMKATKKVTCILRLGKGNSFLGLQDLEAKKIMQMS
jgi:hypothetical protein